MYGTAVHYHRHRGARQSTDVSSLEISDEDPVTNSCLSNDGRVIPWAMDEWVIDITPVASSPLAQNGVLNFSFLLLDYFHLQKWISADDLSTTVQRCLPQAISLSHWSLAGTRVSLTRRVSYLISSCSKNDSPSRRISGMRWGKSWLD